MHCCAKVPFLQFGMPNLTTYLARYFMDRDNHAFKR